MSLNFIKNFSDNINELTPAIVGGKAFSLAGLYQKDFSVPNGFIITTQAFDYFLRSLFCTGGESILSQIIEKGVYFGADMVEIRRKIYASEIPPKLSEAIYNSLISLNTVSVAVRSSTTLEDAERYSYAGQFESFLGVTKEDVLSKVKLCWNSLFSQRVLAYAQGADSIGKMAVIIQEMVAADISGVCFSINPVNYDANAIIIELVVGLGDSLVQGAVVPDRYIVCKDTLIIKEKHVNIGEVIEDSIVKEVARLAVKIEKLYNKPMDVEWALKNGKLYILQARPITTLQGSADLNRGKT
jgi:phosphoenolpyruvate synthase/pyruvate phosphate dikinase